MFAIPRSKLVNVDYSQEVEASQNRYRSYQHLSNSLYVVVLV